MAKARRATNYVFTAARAEALRKARVASARSRSAKAQARSTMRADRSKKRFTPYTRFTRHSQTVGIHGRTKIAGTNRRLVVGAHIRVEKIGRTTVADKFVPRTTVRHGKVKSSFGQHVKEVNIGRRRGGRSNAV